MALHAPSAVVAGIDIGGVRKPAGGAARIDAPWVRSPSAKSRGLVFPRSESAIPKGAERMNEAAIRATGFIKVRVVLLLEPKRKFRRLATCTCQSDASAFGLLKFRPHRTSERVRRSNGSAVLLNRTRRREASILGRKWRRGGGAPCCVTVGSGPSPGALELLGDRPLGTSTETAELVALSRDAAKRFRPRVAPGPAALRRQPDGLGLIELDGFHFMSLVRQAHHAVGTAASRGAPVLRYGTTRQQRSECEESQHLFH